MKTEADPPLILVSTICGHIAMWATRQSPYHAPEGLSDALRTFQIALAGEICRESRFGCFWLKLDAQAPAVHLRKILLFHLLSDPQVLKWNERMNGNKSPFAFVSRYDRPTPDDDFIDLDALIGNIARSVMEEHRRESLKSKPPWWTWCRLASQFYYAFNKPAKSPNP